MAKSFVRFHEDFLIFAAKQEIGGSAAPVGIHHTSVNHFTGVPDAWKSEALVMLARQGFGSSVNTGDDQEFVISAEGRIEAERITSSRTVLGKLKIFTVDNWLAILALIVAVFK